MARGWESKSVEAQQADAGLSAPSRPTLSVTERDRFQQRRSLELALAETQAQLSVACKAAHRDMLRQRLQAIRAALDALEMAP